MRPATDSSCSAAAMWQRRRRDAATRNGLESSLRGIFGDRVSRAEAIRKHHSQDEAYHVAVPDFVAVAHSTSEVARVVKVCAEVGCPITCWGAGTSLEGNALAIAGGLCLDLSEMNRVLAVRSDELNATVQAGVRRQQLNLQLKGTGLFFPVDPGADATIGGMTATRASGTTAVRYGTMRSNVLACTVVMADGRVIETARRAPKSAAGYDLTALLIGSEGTLGIMTEVTVRLHPLPEHVVAAIAAFGALDDAVQASMQCIQIGLGVARIELLDEAMMAAVNAIGGAKYAARPTLFVEFHGMHALVDAQLRQFGEICDSLGGEIVHRAQYEEERIALWKTRHEALYASKALRPGSKVLITDVCVPVSRLAECITETRADLNASGLPATIAGHVGDGNFHAFIMLDPHDRQEVARAEALHERMARRAIAMDGTCTGEHGIGVGKQALLRDELGAAVSVMGRIKAALDPQQLLNPGKIFHV